MIQHAPFPARPTVWWCKRQRQIKTLIFACLSKWILKIEFIVSAMRNFGYFLAFCSILIAWTVYLWDCSRVFNFFRLFIFSSFHACLKSFFLSMAIDIIVETQIGLCYRVHSTDALINEQKARRTKQNVSVKQKHYVIFSTIFSVMYKCRWQKWYIFSYSIQQFFLTKWKKK